VSADPLSASAAERERQWSAEKSSMEALLRESLQQLQQQRKPVLSRCRSCVTPVSFWHPCAAMTCAMCGMLWRRLCRLKKRCSQQRQRSRRPSSSASFWRRVASA
jgi:hypothetical protein